MRGFSKAAALLSSTLTSALVIPTSNSLSVRPLEPVIEYIPSNAQLKFAINNVEANLGYPVFTFQVEGTERACGESNVRLNGQRLEPRWDGIRAQGQDFVDVYGGSEAFWSISCLYESTPFDGSYSNGEDVVHVFSLRFGDSTERWQPGFTLSYKQMGIPAIFRFRPRATNASTIDANVNRWRIPSIEFDPDILASEHEESTVAPVGPSGHGQKSLIQAFKSTVNSAIEGFRRMCPTHSKVPEATKDLPTLSPFHLISSDRLIEPSPASEPSASPEQANSEQTDTTSTLDTVQNLPAAETTSLTPHVAFQPTATPLPPSSSSPSSTHLNSNPLKIFGLCLIFFSFLTWLVLHCRDPRARVERASRREERRNRRLYRRAACHHKIKNWFWTFRLKHGLVSSTAVSFDEKRTRVIQQEDVLENVMKDDMRALRNAHRVVGGITAAEEGRSRHGYESEGSDRRSVSTLPGYESDGSEPPSYDDSGTSPGGVTVVNEFLYLPAETGFTPDSSVVSTSPRISRDGTNSDFDEKFEAISLDSSRAIEAGR